MKPHHWLLNAWKQGSVFFFHVFIQLLVRTYLHRESCLFDRGSHPGDPFHAFSPSTWHLFWHDNRIF